MSICFGNIMNDMNHFWTDYQLTCNEIKLFLSTCTSMLKCTKLLGRGTRGLPTSSCMLYFSKSMLCFEIILRYFCIWVHLNLHVCISGRVCIHYCTNIQHNFAFSAIHGLLHSPLFTVNIIFLLHPFIFKCIKDGMSSYSTSRARRWLFI